jgi:Zn-dependent protease
MNEIIVNIAILAVPILLAVTVHEMAHGYAALKFGDPTAKMAGRLTFNPLKHLDVVGTLAFIITQMVGWAKPVPVNPMYFKNPRQDMLWVSAAGPASNLVMAFIFSLLLRLILIGVNVLPAFLIEPLYLIARAGIFINVGLAVFNLLPIPPLDGSGILSGLLPPHLARQYDEIGRYGFVILLILIFTGLVDKIIVPIIKFFVSILLIGLV